MTELEAKLMQANAGNSELSNYLWNALAKETAAHEESNLASAAAALRHEEEIGGLRERVQGKERDL